MIDKKTQTTIDKLRKKLAALDELTGGRDKETAQAKFQRQRAAQRSNISPIGKPQDPERRAACEQSLQLFLETYFAEAFPLAWSADHLEVIAKTEKAIGAGGQFAVAMPRGSGKTSIHQRSAIWAIVYGFHQYVFLVCADAKKAKEALRSIKTEFEYNELLHADFPEVTKPIRELQGAALAGRKQHVDGVATLIDWTAERAQFARVEGSKASGSMIGVGSISGAARGAQVVLTSGKILRPSLLLVDDFQTRESAASVLQSTTRLNTLTGDLMAMRGPDSPLAALVTATVIYQGDAADQLLDRDRFAEWHGVRKKLVYAWPDNDKLWEEYTELRRQAMRGDSPPTAATEFYQANREAMDLGAVVAWDERYQADEVSALQHAYNLRMADPDAFSSEYQNEPAGDQTQELSFLGVKEISGKILNDNLPADTRHITAGIDVQGNSLWYVIAAWQDGFAGRILDRGVYPKQNRRYFTQTNLPKTFGTLWPTLSEDEAIYRGLWDLVIELAGRRWTLDNGVQLAASRVLIDEGYKDATVHSLCRQTPHAALVAPAKGYGMKASTSPMNEWAVRPGESVGHNWRYRLANQSRSLRHVLFDANYWKTFLHERLATQPGGSGCLSLQGGSPLDWEQFAWHFHAEYPVKTEGRGREVVEWFHKPTRPDNHWFDAAAMAAVAASTAGSALIGQAPPEKPQRRRRKKATYAQL